MKQCSKCKTMYSGMENACPGCSMGGRDAEEGWAVLTTVMNDIEFGVVEGLMEMAGIKVIRRVKGLDEIIAGISMNGIDVMVPGDRMEEASQLLNSEVEEESM